MEKNSLSINAVLYVIRNIMKIIFPLVTFPYISRVLGVQNIGTYNFSNSFVNYFVLIADLGIATYAVREGSRIRNNNEKVRILINEIFTINIISTLVSYILLVLILLVSKDLHTHILLIVILSTKLIFNTLGLEWVYTIYEDFLYITIRSIVIQFFSLILMFVFVKNKNDLYTYAAITVVASVGSNLYNWIHSKKYCKAQLTKNINIKKHLKPILLIFATTISISIYSTSDMVILGLLSGAQATGLYSVSAKVFDIAKSTLAAIILVSIPRLSSILGKGNFSEYENLSGKIYKTLISLATPTMIGIMLLGKDVVLIISGIEYIDAVPSLRILCIAAIINLGAWFYGQCVLIPLKKEKIMFNMSILTALLNIILNIILIPVWKENAAAFTTLISEFVSFAIVSIYSGKYVKFTGVIKTYLKTMIGCMVLSTGVLFIMYQKLSIYLEIILAVGLGGFLYLVTEIALHNNEFISLVLSFLKWSKKKLGWK